VEAGRRGTPSGVRDCGVRDRTGPPDPHPSSSCVEPSGDRKHHENTHEEISMSPTTDTQQSANSTTSKQSKGFTAEERAAMRERAKELKAAASKADGEKDVLAKIAEMQKPDRVIAERIHTIVTATAPDLTPRTWYGMPAYAKDDKVVCHFRDAQKFKTRYATFGFSDKANLDEGAMWPTDFAVKELTPEVEKRIASLVKNAMS
jgi:uncharacterized protein YdhG (YjbR/CyaY superfamily)